MKNKKSRNGKFTSATSIPASSGRLNNDMQRSPFVSPIDKSENMISSVTSIHSLPFNRGKRKNSATEGGQCDNFESKRKREALHPEAIELSRLLSDLSRAKKSDDAKSLYWNAKYDSIRDGHHACILIDCFARCGDTDSAEAVMEQLESEAITIEIHTAMLKVYVHSGKMQKAVALFRKITSDAVSVNQRPNVRTLNTLLRGCLWAAAVPASESGEVFGGVVSSEEAWKLFCSLSDSHIDFLDSSSYEYSISLLCQALRTDDAETRINQFQAKHSIFIRGKATITGSDDQAILETLGVVYLALGRAFALLGKSGEMWIALQRCLSAIRSSKRSLLRMSAEESRSNFLAPSLNGKRNMAAIGGKQAWKKSEISQSRSQSNFLYRTHRLSEMEAEAIDLIKCRESVQFISSNVVSHTMVRKLFYFSGAGTTDLSVLNKKSRRKKNSIPECNNHFDYILSTWLSFGLAAIAKTMRFNLTTEHATSINLEEIQSSLKIPVHEYLDDSGRLNIDSIFDNHSRPLDIEVGAGFGDWIVVQAQNNPLRNYIAVELRADRVSKIFTKALVQKNKPLENLCIVGSECSSFLRHRLARHSISTIFANHPEPPTQVLGNEESDLQSIMRGGQEPAHMLNSQTIVNMIECLRHNGKIIIVTDNKSYARFLSATFSFVIQNLSSKLRSLDVKELKDTDLQCSEIIGGNVHLFEGRPSLSIGHSDAKSEQGTSYFDRLWKTVGARHSEIKTRFVLIFQIKNKVTPSF